MASLEIIETCEGEVDEQKCQLQKKVRVKKKDGTVVGEFCSKCGHKALRVTAEDEKK